MKLLFGEEEKEYKSMLKDISKSIQKEKDKLNKERQRIEKECDGGKHSFSTFTYCSDLGNIYLVKTCLKCTFTKTEMV